MIEQQRTKRSSRDLGRHNQPELTPFCTSPPRSLQVAVDAFPEDSWNIKDATQLRQIEVFLRMEGIEIGEKLTNLKTFTNQKFIDKGSGFEKFVSEALTEIGFKHEREVYPFPSTLGWKTGDKRR